MSESQLNAFRRENIPAYGAVMGSWLGLSATLSALAAVRLTRKGRLSGVVMAACTAPRLH